MPFKTSKRTVRVTELPSSVDTKAFADVAERLSSGLGKRRSSHSRSLFQPSSASTGKLVISLSPQFGDKVGTITFPSEAQKGETLKNHKTDWKFDDKFNGVTVLYSPNDPDLDICAVHGLNGNAFDTWAGDNVMWLRDLLPRTEPFDQARIMTFGYNSHPTDSKNLSGLKEWAIDLLNSASSVRESEKERKRPLIFVCHSLGGLIARQAMIRLDSFQEQTPGIELNHCGLLFLATPHSGTTKADWGNYLFTLADLTLGLRKSVIDNLKSFNPHSTESKEAFANMRIIPPYECLYETEMTKVANTLRHIVTADSAGLNNKTASPVPDVDHRMICRFDSKFDNGFRIVVMKLNLIRKLLLNSSGVSNNAAAATNFSNLPGSPRPVAPHYPRARGRPFYEGKYLRMNHTLKGRTAEMASLKECMEKSQEGDTVAIAITGIGGIGKTELLLDIACQHRNQTDVFFFRASDAESLKNAYLSAATKIGHDLLSSQNPKQDLQAIWRNMSPDERLESFKAWLEDPENEHALFIVDDIDGVKNIGDINDALPRGPRSVLFSTRNPHLRQDLLRRCYPLSIAPTTLPGTIEIMEAMVIRTDYRKGDDLFSRDDLRQIAEAVHCHPLAASHAIKYITRVVSQQPSESPARAFLAIFKSPNFEERRQFFDYKPTSATLSILETFDISRTRLRDPNGLAWKLMEFTSFLETDHTLVDARSFFFHSQCLLDDLEDLPEHHPLSASKAQLSEAFSEIESVSFGTRPQMNTPFEFHPLWLECARHRAGAVGRVRCIRQVLLICHRLLAKADMNKTIYHDLALHVDHCLRVSATFQIELEELKLPPPTYSWAYKMVVRAA